MRSKKPHVCFVAPNAYAALTNRSDLTHIGGAEVQQALLTKGLAQSGHEVDMITLDHGRSDAEYQNDVRILKMCGPDAGWPLLRFIHPRWTSLWRALSRANADIYYQRTTGVETGQVAMWCHFHKRPFVFALANDTNCDPRLPDLKRFHERWLFRWGLRHASRVICQTNTQAVRLRQHFGTNSTVIRNGAMDPFDGEWFSRTAQNGDRKRILWIGRFSRKKRLEWLLALAKCCPNLAFDVVGDGNTSDFYVDNLKESARQIPNISLHGKVPHLNMGEMYNRADLLVCTSLVEGFPNIFLEAWARGLPIVSSFDPDDIIQRNQLGYVAHTVDELMEGMEYLLSNPHYWRACSRRSRAYFLANHSIQSTVQSLSDLLCSMMTSHKRHGDEAAVSTNAPTVQVPTSGRSLPL